MNKAEEINNPRRILAVSLEDATNHLSRVVKELTGTSPTPAVVISEDSSSAADTVSVLSHAGTTHDLRLKTAYYNATVPIWLDILNDPSDWAATFLAPEAREVLDVLGGVVVVFALRGDAEQTRALLKQVGRVVGEGLGGWDWDGVGLAVGVGVREDEDPGAYDEWDDLCTEAGLEFVVVPDATVKGGNVKHVERTEKGAKHVKDERDAFGERMGIARVKEALEANDWSGGGVSGGDLDDLVDKEEGNWIKAGESSDESDGKGNFRYDPSSLGLGFNQEDFAELREALWAAGKEGNNGMDGNGGTNPTRVRSGDEHPAAAASVATELPDPGQMTVRATEDEDSCDEVLKLEGMMRKLQAVRHHTVGMPDEQRRRVAARAVAEVMREL